MGLKKLFQTISILLPLTFVVSAYTACGEETGGAAKPQNPVVEQTEHLVTNGRLHKVEITPTDKAFITNGRTDYQIVVTPSDWVRKAGTFIKSHLELATGAELPIVNATSLANTKWTEDKKYVVFGYDAWFEDAGLQLPQEDLGVSGYYIKTVGNTIFVKTSHEYGYQHAALALLDAMVGYEMYSWDTVVYEKASSTLPLQSFNVIERPDVDIHASGNNLVDKDAQYGMGFLDRGNAFISIQGAISKPSAHNAMEFLEYAGNNQGVTIDLGWISTSSSFTLTPSANQIGQVCYTGGASYGVKPDKEQDADGYAYFETNKAALEEKAEQTVSALVDTVANVIIEVIELDENKNKTVISFTNEDNSSTNCRCWKCEEEAAYYHNSRAASIVKFINRVNAKVQAYLQSQATALKQPKRSLDVLFFAYQWSQDAPAVKNAEGKWVPIDENVVCDENVAVWLAPIAADYTQSFYAEENESTKNMVEAWHALSSKTYFWLYQTNFHYYFYPLDSVDSMVETYRLCKKNGMTFLYNQGQYTEFACPYSAFTMLKEYVDSKAGFDVNVNFDKLTDDFFANYFGAASASMREYYDQLCAYMDDLKEQYPTEYDGTVYNEISNVMFWKFGTLKTWMGLIDNAYTAIADYKTSDPVLYQKLFDHITRESLFVRFVLIDVYGYYYADATLQAMKEDFKADCERLNVAHTGENNGRIDGLWAVWGV